MYSQNNLQEVTIKMLREGINNDINTDIVCRDAVKINNIVRAEYNENNRRYVLYISKYYKKLANQYNISYSVNYNRMQTAREVEDLFSKYYGEDNYSLDFGNDYNGEWWVYIKDDNGHFNYYDTSFLPSDY